MKLSTIKTLYPNAAHYEQVGAEPLFEVGYSKERGACTLLVSYQTVIGESIDSERPAYFYVTTEKYSSTTSKQTTQFLATHAGERVSPTELEALLRVHEAA